MTGFMKLLVDGYFEDKREIHVSCMAFNV